MNPSFFQSFWKLISSQLTTINESTESTTKFLKDVFSTTFARAIDFAPDDAKSEFNQALREKAEFVAVGDREITSLYHRMINKTAILVLVDWMSKKSPKLSVIALIDAVFVDDSSVDDIIEIIETPILTRVLSALLDKESQDVFLVSLESRLLPRLTTDYEKSHLLSACPLLSKDLEFLMARTVSEIADWCRDPDRVTSDLELILTVLANTPRINLFKQVANIAPLKEQFLVTLAVGLRTALAMEPEELGPIVEAVQQIFFFVPSIGVVMDRWLDKEIKKYNKDLDKRVRQYLSSTGQLGQDALRTALRSGFPSSDEVWVPIPSSIEAAIGDFIESYSDEEPKFRQLPCAMTAEVAGGILRFFPTWFDVAGDKARLTPFAASIAVDSARKSVVEAPKQAQVSVSESTPSGDDLVDILLREILNKLPQHAFLSRSAPVKIQTGVYRFGTREVTFHTKAGKLLVYRVGGYISESDAIDFIAREYNVAAEKLGSLVSGSVIAVPSESVRRPMEWENQEFLSRVVRLGLRARDPVWREGWEAFARLEGLQENMRDPKDQPVEVLAKFLEQNIAHATRQDWAKDLLYFTDKKVNIDSDNEDLGLDEGISRRPVGIPGRPVSLPSPPSSHPNFKTRLCVNFPLGKCTRGAACAYAHGDADLRGPPGSAPGPSPQAQQFYKTRICHAFMEGRCTRGAACSYAHSEAERMAHAHGVVKRDVKATEDVRLAEKRKALARARARSDSRSRSGDRTDTRTNTKPLQYIPTSREEAKRSRKEL